MFTEEEIYGIKVLTSEHIAKNAIVPLGKALKPENWLNMTHEEQVLWALENASAIAMHPNLKWGLEDAVNKLKRTKTL